MGLSTHVLNLVTGLPAVGVGVALSVDGQEIIRMETNADGRCPDLLKGASLKTGAYRLSFEAGRYWTSLDPDRKEDPFFDTIPIDFRITDIARHYHVPLLLSPYGYSTYRGS